MLSSLPGKASAILFLVGCIALSVAAPASVAADARTDYLVRALRTSPTFRVRAQAALSLGRVDREAQVITVLRSALRDDHPAVRAAAASSLGRQGDPSALPDLRRRQRDRESAVRTAVNRAITSLERVARSNPSSGRNGSSRSRPSGGAARFYVVVGNPASNVRGVSRGSLDNARRVIVGAVRGVPGVEIAPRNENRSAASRVIRSRHLTGYYLDTSIVAIENRPGGGTRARVSVVLQTYPERNIRSMMSGAATVTGETGSRARQQAIEGALRGALRNLAQAMNASTDRR